MRLQDFTWANVDALSRDNPVVVPIAAVEQHGRHLPVYTNSFLRGNSDHQLDFNGILTAPLRVDLNRLVGSLDDFLGHGFRVFTDEVASLLEHVVAWDGRSWDG